MMRKEVMMLKVPPYRQVDDFDCGFGISISVLLYYGKDVEYQEIGEFLGTSESGTPFPRIIDLMNLPKYGLDCRKKRMRIGEIKKWIRRGNPIILPLQAWSENPVTSYKKSWENGHYVAAIGFDDNNKKILFRDPSSDSITYVSYKELKDRWHDVGNDGEVYKNHGIVVRDRKGSFSLYDENFNPDTAVHMN